MAQLVQLPTVTMVFHIGKLVPGPATLFLNKLTANPTEKVIENGSNTRCS